MEDKIETLIRSMFENHTDAEIAEKIGKSRSYVASYRITNEIPVFKKWDRYNHLLGVLPDIEIAKMLGVNSNSVTAKRIRAGIPSPVTGKESKLQKKFVKNLENPRQYVRTPYGIIDVLDDKFIYELKTPLTTGSANSAVGQLLAYKNEYPDRKLAIVTDKIFVNGKTRQHLDQLFISLILFED